MRPCLEKKYVYLFVYVRMCAHIHVYGSQRIAWGESFLFYYVTSRRSNLGHQHLYLLLSHLSLILTLLKTEYIRKNLEMRHTPTTHCV